PKVLDQLPVREPRRPREVPGGAPQISQARVCVVNRHCRSCDAIGSVSAGFDTIVARNYWPADIWVGRGHAEIHGWGVLSSLGTQRKLLIGLKPRFEVLSGAPTILRHVHRAIFGKDRQLGARVRIQTVL